MLWVSGDGENAGHPTCHPACQPRRFADVRVARFQSLLLLQGFQKCNEHGRNAQNGADFFLFDSEEDARWTAQQIIEAFPWDTAPKYLLGACSEDV